MQRARITVCFILSAVGLFAVVALNAADSQFSVEFISSDDFLGQSPVFTEDLQVDPGMPGVFSIDPDHGSSHTYVRFANLVPIDVDPTVTLVEQRAWYEANAVRLCCR